MKTKTLSFLALGFAMSSIGLMCATNALALPPNGYAYDYYADAAHTDPVGEKYLSCSGAHGQVGTVTQYVEVTTWDCNVGDPPGFPF